MTTTRSPVHAYETALRQGCSHYVAMQFDAYVGQCWQKSIRPMSCTQWIAHYEAGLIR